MPFALRLHDTLRNRERQFADELAAGDSLETVLERHLIAVEASAETDLLTSILLLDPDGKRLRHAAAPTLPASYCEAIDGAEIGPEAGSCGTAAYLGHAVYVTDIETDDLWKDYRDLALDHGLHACWSTPIRDAAGAVLGTFAIYHLTPRSPTPDEDNSIRLITSHVAQAIIHSRAADGTAVPEMDALPSEARFRSYANKLERLADMVSSPKLAEALKAVAADCRALVANVRGDPNSRDHSRN
jgi:GAF domain-containing protein